ncbi:DEAD/DEAH box helicase [Alteraurantiacibacter aquimixticola]|uniref:DEAD-box ATP-dependent RNA helicase RhpA n=1 Tax=Alteraurantiacibacter aquimixticola TaxID=2489173 RepID=A0A4T3F5Q1_9SPHN|nr:DEAD/DEAH box helicase [Alteraurantiacibacter aquimixticola]TIX51809.1 DEAD/DEAH box helicase [Alteraurantiacibacter aquimixticola]
MSYFSDLGLAEPILRALEEKGYNDPTPIQRQAIPALLEGRDILGIAQTGTGKTAAFSLPSLHRLAQNPTGRYPQGCRMLVLSPTRELAAQIADNMRLYARFLNLSVQCIFGGVPVSKNINAMRKGADILVATPGRLLDLIEQRALTLDHVEIFVLDEADQMMDLGFIKPLTRIANLLPKNRQSLFFSATMPSEIAKLGEKFISNPVKVEVAPQSTTAERVDQYVTHIDQKEKQALLTLTLQKGLATGEIESSLVFTRTKHGADRVVRFLVAAGIEAAAIHGNKSQAQRTRALDGFRAGRIAVLVATDIAARGIDVPGVSAVFNFEIPNVPEQYVHRIGRTARAGRSGLAISFVAPDEKSYMRDICRLTGVQPAAYPLPKDFIALAERLPKPSRKAAGAEHSEERREGRGGGGRGGRSGGNGGGSNRRQRGRNSRPKKDPNATVQPRGNGRRGGGQQRRNRGSNAARAQS